MRKLYVVSVAVFLISVSYLCGVLAVYVGRLPEPSAWLSASQIYAIFLAFMSGIGALVVLTSLLVDDE